MVRRPGKGKLSYLQKMLVALLGGLLILSLSCSASSSATTEPSQARPPSPRAEPTATPAVAVTVASTEEHFSYAGEVRAIDQVALVSKVAQRLQELKVGVGDKVKKGELVVVLEHSTLEAEVKRAEATVAAAEASLAKLEAGPRREQVKAAEAAEAAAKARLELLLAGATKEQIEAAEAAVVGAEARIAQAIAAKEGTRQAQAVAERQYLQALAAREVAKQAWENGILLRDNPQELNARIDAARAQVEVANAQVAKIKAVMAGKLQPNPLDVADLQAAEANLKGAQDNLNNLLAMRDNPIQANAAVAAAKSQYDLAVTAVLAAETARDAAITTDKVGYDQAVAGVLAAQAARDAAKAQLAALKAPPRPQLVAELEAAVAAAQHQLELIKTPYTAQDLDAARAQVTQARIALQLAKMRYEEAFLYSPIDGYVSSRRLSVGDFASGDPAPSTILILVSNQMEIVVAVGESFLKEIKIGQPGEITVPAFPNRIFPGKIRTVAAVASPVTRTFEVFATPVDPEGLLRPGMSATLTLGRGSAGQRTAN